MRFWTGVTVFALSSIKTPVGERLFGRAMLSPPLEFLKSEDLRHTEAVSIGGFSFNVSNIFMSSAQREDCET